MKKITLLFCLLFISISTFAETNFFKDYSGDYNNPKINGVLSVKADFKDCSPYILVDKIKSYNSVEDGISITTLKSDEYRFDITYREIDDLDSNKSKDLLNLLKTKDEVVFIGSLCGVSGGSFSVELMIKLKAIK